MFCASESELSQTTPLNKMALLYAITMILTDLPLSQWQPNMPLWITHHSLKHQGMEQSLKYHDPREHGGARQPTDEFAIDSLCQSS